MLAQETRRFSMIMKQGGNNMIGACAPLLRRKALTLHCLPLCTHVPTADIFHAVLGSGCRSAGPATKQTPNEQQTEGQAVLDDTGMTSETEGHGNWHSSM